MVGLYLGYSIYSPMLLGVFDTPYMVSDFLKEREAVVNSLPVKPRTATYVIESARCTLDPPAVEYVGSVNVKDKVKRSDGSDDIKEYRYFFKELTINELFKEFNTKDMDTLYTKTWIHCTQFIILTACVIRISSRKWLRKTTCLLQSDSPRSSCRSALRIMLLNLRSSRTLRFSGGKSRR